MYDYARLVDGNGNISPTGAADYVAAWQHVRQVFTDQGVTNVVYIWVLMATTFRSGTAAHGRRSGS